VLHSHKASIPSVLVGGNLKLRSGWKKSASRISNMSSRCSAAHVSSSMSSSSDTSSSFTTPASQLSVVPTVVNYPFSSYIPGLLSDVPSNNPSSLPISNPEKQSSSLLSAPSSSTQSVQNSDGSSISAGSKVSLSLDVGQRNAVEYSSPHFNNTSMTPPSQNPFFNAPSFSFKSSSPNSPSTSPTPFGLYPVSPGLVNPSPAPKEKLEVCVPKL
jgi:hypothetical protein